MVAHVRKPVILLGLLAFMLCGGLAVSQDLNSAIHLTRSEQFSFAERQYKALLDKSPNNGDIYFYFANNYLARFFADSTIIPYKEMADSANMLFQRGVQAEPTNPINFVGLMELSLMQKDFLRANELRDKAISLMPSKQNKTIVMTPERQALIWIKMADAFVKSRDNDTAQIFGNLRKAEKLDPKNYEQYIVKGDAYILFLNDGSKAISNYNMASAMNPESPTAKLRIGQLWMKARQYQMALNYYQDVVKIDSTFAPAYRELGFLLSKAGRNEEAKKNFKKFLELSAGNIGSRLQYINTLMELQDYGEALNEVLTVLNTDKSNNDLNRALAYSYFETGQYEKGLAAIEQFINNSPDEKRRALDYAYWGRLLSKTKHDSLAGVMLMKAYDMDTSKTDLVSEAALAFNKVKNYPRAVELYQMKISLKKASPMDYYNLGKTYYNLQDFKMADSMLAIFNEQQPTYIQGFVWRARASSKLDPDSKLGTAKPVYEAILEKTASDTLKYQKERIESLYYLTFYYFQVYSDGKVKEDGLKAIEYGERIVAIDPNDENAVKSKQIIDILKKNIK
jgi:tetratricopeptide (TPR) repeat protein